MKLHLRAPREHEWGICRMLLPETFANAAVRDYLLCLRDEAPHIVAAASFRKAADAIADLRVHVVSSFRRRGVGSQLLLHLAGSGANVLEGSAEIAGQPEIEAFCARNGFLRVDALTTVEAEISGMREYMRGLRTRLQLPPGACLIRVSDAPVDRLAGLHSQYVAQEGSMNPWRFLVANTPGIGHSPVIVMEGRVMGMLLWEREEAVAVVRSRVVLPGHWGSRLNAVLLSEGLDGAWASGARRVRFCFTDSNRDTRKLAARFQARVVSVVAQFRRQAAS